jgi:hypothetical protein
VAADKLAGSIEVNQAAGTSFVDLDLGLGVTGMREEAITSVATPI